MLYVKKVIALIALFFLAACQPGGNLPADLNSPSTPIPDAEVTLPEFEHVVIIVFENKEYKDVIGNADMPAFNQFAEDYTLLTQYYGVRHPSLPNYISMIGGETFGITENCIDCFINAPSLPDLIEDSGRTWKAYQEDMPSPCFVGNDGSYAQKHNPFVYFDPIRLDQARCESRVVPLDALQADIEAGRLPNFIFITPNMCNNSHDCTLDVTDDWLAQQTEALLPALEADGPNYLLVVMFEEGDDSLLDKAGGRVPVILISPLVKKNYQDNTDYSHYSLLKTISRSWELPYLGHAADMGTSLIAAPWK